MRIAAGLLLVLCSGGLWYLVRSDIAEYARFKLLSDTNDRQRFYRLWVVKGFQLSGASLLGLAMLRRLHDLVVLPLEFRGLSGYLRHFTTGLKISSGFLIGLSIPMAIGSVAGAILMKRRSSQSATVAVGDIGALMPRNWPETAHTALLSLNAGLSEELYFRLFLPLLLTLVGGNATCAFIIAAAVFGAVHVYQGAAGVLATAMVGCALTAIYLASGSIWVAVGVHAAIDLVGLVIRPTFGRLIKR